MKYYIVMFKFELYNAVVYYNRYIASLM